MAVDGTAAGSGTGVAADVVGLSSIDCVILSILEGVPSGLVGTISIVSAPSSIKPCSAFCMSCNALSSNRAAYKLKPACEAGSWIVAALETASG